MSDPNSTVEYRPVVGFPGYRVGSDGSVWTRWQRVNLGWRYGSKYVLGEEWHRMSPGAGAKGHLIVTLCPGRHTRFVHRLVLEAFVGPRPKGMLCRHFPDRDPANNAVSNLNWGTPRENQEDRAAHGTECRGESHPMSRLTDGQVRSIREEYAAGGVTHQQIGQKYGVHKSMVSLIVRRKAWSHVG